LTLGYNWGPWTFSGVTTYIGKSYLDDQFLAAFDAPPKSASVGSKTYQDVQVRYAYNKMEFYLGIDNLFDTKAPVIPSGLPGNTTGAETNAGIYDAIGRRYYAGFRVGI
jgi:hypothetical protein